MKTPGRRLLQMLLLCSLILAFGLTASADLTREQALNVARKQVPSSYRLTRADHEAEDMEWEFDFLSKNSRIQFEVTVNEHTSKVIEVERTNLFDLGGRSVDITPAKAKKAVKAKFKKARITAVRIDTDTEPDGKRYVYEVKFRIGSTRGEADVNAQTGKLIKWTLDF